MLLQSNLLYGGSGASYSQASYGGAPGMAMNPAVMSAAAGTAALRAGDAQQQLAMLAARGAAGDPASLAALSSMNAANGTANMQVVPFARLSSHVLTRCHVC